MLRQSNPLSFKVKFVVHVGYSEFFHFVEDALVLGESRREISRLLDIHPTCFETRKSESEHDPHNECGLRVFENHSANIRPNSD